jgi:hypothetical protein
MDNHTIPEDILHPYSLMAFTQAKHFGMQGASQG